MQINYTFHWPMKTENFNLQLARKLYSSPLEKGIISLSGNKVGGCAVVEYDEMYFHKHIRENLFVFYWEHECCQLFTGLLYD